MCKVEIDIFSIVIYDIIHKIPFFQFILLQFEEFILEDTSASKQCYDSVTIYDGSDNSFAPLGSYCGKYLWVLYWASHVVSIENETLLIYLY